MKRFVSFIIFAALNFLCSVSAYSFIVSSALLKKNDPETGKEHFVVILGDAHLKTPANIQDLENLSQFYKILKNHEIKLSSVYEVSDIAFAPNGEGLRVAIRQNPMLVNSIVLNAVNHASKSLEKTNVFGQYRSSESGDLFTCVSLANREHVTVHDFIKTLHKGLGSIAILEMDDCTKANLIPFTLNMYLPELRRFKNIFPKYKLREYLENLSLEKEKIIAKMTALRTNSELSAYLDEEFSEKLAGYNKIEETLLCLFDGDLNSQILSSLYSKYVNLIQNKNIVELDSLFSHIEILEDKLKNLPEFSVNSLSQANRDKVSDRDVSVIFTGCYHSAEMIPYFIADGYVMLHEDVLSKEFIDSSPDVLTVLESRNKSLNLANIFSIYSQMILESKLSSQQSLSSEFRCAKCKKFKSDLKKCSACGKASYCGVACQKADWKHHKIHCKKKT